MGKYWDIIPPPKPWIRVTSKKREEDIPKLLKETHKFLEERALVPYQAKHIECLHKTCPNCHGTGTNKFGVACLHMLSCPCSECTPWMGIDMAKGKDVSVFVDARGLVMKS